MNILIIHITIALSSIVLSTLAAVAPTQAKLNASYGLIGATLATGTYLVIARHTSLLHVCAEGLLYLAVTLSAVGIAQHKLVLAHQHPGR